jgi:inosine-uridine nucleoside N-ribohydrolase
MVESPRPPVPIVIETDLCDDVDDAGALAVAHALADAGLVDIRGIGINTSGHWSHSAARVINSYYGRPAIPVGILHPITDAIGPEDYARAISRMHPHAATPEAMPEAVTVLREALAGAEDDTVTLVSIGYFGNLVALLDSTPDAVSPLSGSELVRAKVARAVVMGGVFGRRAVPKHGGEPEFETNFVHDRDQTARFLSEWPSPVDLVGWEAAADVVTGRALAAAQGELSPIAIAYALHSGRGTGRASWDLLAVLLAALDLDGLVSWSEPGTAAVDAEARTLWSPAVGGAHRHAIAVAHHEELASFIDDYLGRRPRLGAWGVAENRTEVAAWH